MRLIALAMMMVALAACDNVKSSSDTAARVSKNFVDDTGTAWRDLFTYHRPRDPQDPQTRFCYQMQSDIVCYDAPQTHMTSKLMGYQQGDQISYIQQGGGSMGVSTPRSQVFTAPAGSVPDMAAPYSDVQVYEGAVSAPVPNPAECTPGMTPFECKESQYVPNAEVGR